MKSLKNLSTLCAALLLLATSSFALAEQADRTKPIQVTADFGSLDQKNEITLWKGNVLIVQGTLRFTAAQVIVSRTKDGQQHVVATGSPVTFQQKLDNTPDLVKGRGAKVTYGSKTNVVVLTGNAQVSRGGDVVTGNQITYNTVTEFYTVDSGAKQRVSVILQPSTTQKKK